MAITFEGSTLFETTTTGPGFYTTVDEEATVQSGTTLSILSIHMRADIDVTELPSWNGTEDFTLIHQTTSSGNSLDTHTYIYGLVSPTATTADIDYTIDSSDMFSHTLMNFSGTETSSVANATNYLNEDVNDTATSTGVHSSAGTSGRTLVLAGTHASAAGDPMSNNATFTEVSEGDAFDSSSGISYYVCYKLAGAPTAVTITYSESNENSSALIELIPASGLSIPVAMHNYRRLRI